MLPPSWLSRHGEPGDLHHFRGRQQGQPKEAELFQQIGRLQMELEWLKKKSQLL
jgi:hypothetical protein